MVLQRVENGDQDMNVVDTNAHLSEGREKWEERHIGKGRCDNCDERRVDVAKWIEYSMVWEMKGAARGEWQEEKIGSEGVAWG